MKTAISKRLVGKVLTLSTAIAMLSPVSPVEASEKDRRGASDGQEQGASVDRAVFARFPALDADGTLERLETLSTSRESAESLRRLLALLDEGAPLQVLEREMVHFIAKLSLEEAETTIAAILRGYYDASLKSSLEDGTLNRNEVFEELISADQALTVASFGNYPPVKGSHVRR
jgi:hypothetical protein